jgi:ABC-type amino acid transport substrate-binding protein
MNYRKSFHIAVMPLVAGVFFLVGSCAMLFEKSAPSQVLREANINSVRVGIAPNYPPLAFKKDGSIAGIEADMADRLRQDLDISITFFELPFTDLVPALRANKIDMIMSGMSITKKREGLISFSHPYMEINQVAIVRKADVQRFTPPSKALYVNGLRVGYEIGTTGMSFAVETLLLAQLVKFPSADEGLTALKKGEIEAFIHDEPTAWQMTGNDEYKDLVVLAESLTQEGLAWAVRHEDRILLDALNRTIDSWKKQGTLQPILDKWMKTNTGH